MHLEVNVRRTAGIGDGADGAERVAAGGVDLSAAIALEAAVVAGVMRGAWMIVDAVGVALPDFQGGAMDDLAAAVQHAARYMRDLPHGPCRLSLDQHKVGVHVGGKRQGVERPLGL